MAISWQSVDAQRYFLERTPDPTIPFSALQTGITGRDGITRVTDTNAPSPDTFIYRIGVPQ